MAKFAFLLPRPDMVEPAGRIARELGMEVVVNQAIHTDQVAQAVEECRRAQADIIVARGRQASILKNTTDFPVVEIQLTGQEIALLLRRARDLVPHLPHPRVGVVTIANMVGDITKFGEAFDLQLHTYFVPGEREMERGAEQAVADGMDVILGGDFVNAYCRKLGKRTLFFEGTEDSIRAALINARGVGFASDAERRNTAHLQVLLDYSFNGIIELDTQGTIRRINDVACKILDRPREELVGVALDSLMPQEDADIWLGALYNRQELYFSVLEVAGIHVVANAAPVETVDGPEGVVFSFYEMHRMETQGAQALRERYRLQRYLARGRFEDVRHASRTMQQVVRLARTFAESGQPILVLGEVGVGKSLFAQSIHNASPCSQGPFVTFDCGAGWPDQWAALARCALDADGGTLYLDRVDQLAQGSQHALCRLIRESVAYALDSSTMVPVKVRVIASLEDAKLPILSGEGFLPELYYFLVAHRLSLPPLRTRPEDLSQAIDMSLDDCVPRLNRYVVLTKEARKLLMDYSWPGNYIQLHTFLERLALTAPSRTVGDGYVLDLLQQLYPSTVAPLPAAPASSADQPEAAQLAEALSQCGGNRAAAAARLGISKTTLWRRMKKYGIRDHYQS